MSDYVDMVAGFRVDAHRRRLNHDPAMVVLHRVGTDERGFLTPDEAEQLAEALTQAAAVARRDA